VVGAVEKVLGREVMFVPEIAGDVAKQAVGIMQPGSIACLGNTRFWAGEEKNDPNW
jgi:phosphoglycerate kinase